MESKKENLNYNFLFFILIVLTLSSIAISILTYVTLSNKLNELSNENSLLKNEISLLSSRISYLESSVERISSLNVSGVDLSKIYLEVKDSVVVVRGVLVQKGYTFFGIPIVQYSSVLGSGFIINYSNRFYVITNFHVINSAYNISVTLYNGDAYPAKVIGSDSYSDLAVLEVNFSSKVKPIPLASSSSLKVGDVVIAIGSPFGLAGSMTVGIVSQLGRTISESITKGYLIADVIQISTPINPGNSGGPLLNSLGQVVGITTAIVSGSQGVGFAIPSDTILRELPDLVTKGRYDKHPWIGISGIDMTYDIAKYIGCNYTYGVLVASVIKDSPAERAGIRGGSKIVQVVDQEVVVGGDLIIAVNNNRIRNMDDLVSFLEKYTTPGDKIVLTIVRNNQKINIQLTVGSRPSS